MRSISASVFETAGWVTDRNSAARPRCRNSSSATSSCRWRSFRLERRTRSIWPWRHLHNLNGMKRVRIFHWIVMMRQIEQSVRHPQTYPGDKPDADSTRRQFMLGSLGAAALAARAGARASPPAYPDAPSPSSARGRPAARPTSPMRALAHGGRQGAGPADRGREQGRRLRHDRRSRRWRAAKPDGYTIGQIPISVTRFSQLGTVQLDPLKDLTYLARTSGQTFGIAVRADVAVQDAEGPGRRRQGEPRQADLRAPPASAARRTSAWRSSPWPPASSSTPLPTRAARRR